MIFETLDLDAEGQPFLNGIRPKKPLEVPTGWWVAKLISNIRPSTFLTRAKFYRAEVQEVKHGVLVAHGDNSPDWEGYVRHWEYVVAAPQQFVLIAEGDRYNQALSISRVVKYGEVVTNSPDLIHLTYKRGANGWRWVRLQQLLNGLGRSFDELPEELWPLVGQEISRVEWCDEDYRGALDDLDEEFSSFDRESRPDAYRIKVTLKSPRSEVIQAQCPSHDSPRSMYDEALETLPLKKIWIPAGLAKDIMYLLKFVFV